MSKPFIRAPDEHEWFLCFVVDKRGIRCNNVATYDVGSLYYGRYINVCADCLPKVQGNGDAVFLLEY